MNRSRWLVATLVASCAGPAFAQVFNEPTFYVWGWERPDGAALGPRLTNMIDVDGYGYGLGSNLTPDPVQRAQAAAAEIINRVHVAHDLDPNKVCITIFGLGRRVASK